jgi:hypothetical protein
MHRTAHRQLERRCADFQRALAIISREKVHANQFSDDSRAELQLVSTLNSVMSVPAESSPTTLLAEGPQVTWRSMTRLLGTGACKVDTVGDGTAPRARTTKLYHPIWLSGRGMQGLDGVSVCKKPEGDIEHSCA